MQVVSESTLRALVREDEALAAVRRAFRALANGRVRQPSPMSLDFPERSGEIHIKAAHIEGAPVFAVKMATGFYANAAEGVPTGSGLMVVFDAAKGGPLGVLADNAYLTELRTGAAGALAVDLLAPLQIARTAMIGAGQQGRYQLRAMSRVRGLGEIVAWDSDADRLSAYCSDMSQELGTPVRGVESVEAAVKGADLVVTATPSATPLVQAEWLESHATVVALGADAPEKQELDVGVLARADKIVADDWSQCIRLGEIHHAITQGAIELNRIHAELGKVLTGERSGREGRELIVCDLTGVGAQDTAIAEFAWDALKRSGQA